MIDVYIEEKSKVPTVEELDKKEFDLINHYVVKINLQSESDINKYVSDKKLTRLTLEKIRDHTSLEFKSKSIITKIIGIETEKELNRDIEREREIEREKNRTPIKLVLSNKFRNKYLKYKNKYLELKKIIISNK